MADKNFLRYLLTISKFLVYILFIQVISSFAANGQEEIELEPLIITASRIYLDEPTQRVPLHSQDSIEINEFDGLSHFSIPSILRKSTFVDMRRRGPFGVQSDVSIRGAPFEQNLVLLDGININDPQTGHHNMDIPLTLYDIERLDVTYGPASSAYGSGALGGAINIIPKKCEEKVAFYASSSTGSWDFYSNAASINLPLKWLRTRSSFEWKRSTGYMPETEFNAIRASSYTELKFPFGELDFLAGFLKKDFGADSFYSNLYPNEEESINSQLFILKGRINKDDVSIRPRFYMRRYRDKFVLDRNRRESFTNTHTTYLYGGEIISQLKTNLGIIVFGAGMTKEEISSTNLGGHHRAKNNLFLEWENQIYDFIINTKGRLDYYSTFGLEFSPSVALGYAVSPEFTLAIQASRAFRAPTFTDLYYSSPANKGNPGLISEKAWTYDVGYTYAPDGINIGTSVFLRQSSDVIDWTRSSPRSRWEAQNIGKFDMYGVEQNIRIDFEKFLERTFVKNAELRYSYLEGLEKKGVTSKYALQYLKHNLNFTLEHELPFGLTEKINLSFKNRIRSKPYFLLDATINKNIKFNGNTINVFLQLDNILDTDYSEQNDVSMPPRSIYGGISIRF